MSVERSFADVAAMKSGPRLTPFQRWQIVGNSKAGAKAKDIADLVRKKNKERPSLQAVSDVLANAKANPESSPSSAAPFAGAAVVGQQRRPLLRQAGWR